jgi:putative phosphoribosyl transferase
LPVGAHYPTHARVERQAQPHGLALNRIALDQMSCERQLIIVPRATHLFEEPGALDKVARLARDWFLRYLVPAPQPA